MESDGVNGMFDVNTCDTLGFNALLHKGYGGLRFLQTVGLHRVVAACDSWVVTSGRVTMGDASSDAILARNGSVDAGGFSFVAWQKRPEASAAGFDLVDAYADADLLLVGLHDESAPDAITVPAAQLVRLPSAVLV